MKVLGVIIAVIFAAAALLTLSGLFWGWLIMLGVGATHSVWDWPKETLGFWPDAFGIGVVFGLLAGAFRGSTKNA